MDFESMLLPVLAFLLGVVATAVSELQAGSSASGFSLFFDPAELASHLQSCKS